VQLAALGTGATPVISIRQDEGNALAGKTLSLNVSGSRGTPAKSREFNTNKGHAVSG